MDAFAATFHGQQQQRCWLPRASCLCLFACATASVAGEQGKKSLFCTVAFGSCLTRPSASMPREFVKSFNNSGPLDGCQGPDKFFPSSDWAPEVILLINLFLVCGVVWGSIKIAMGE